MATLVESGSGGRVGGAGATRLLSRTAVLSVLLGIYLLLMGNHYLQSYWSHSFVHPLKYLSVGTAFVTEVSHVAIIYGLFVRNFLGSRNELLYALCASLACSLVFTPLGCFTIIAAIVSHEQEVVGLWEMPRVGLTLFHMFLVHDLLKKLRASETTVPLSTPMSASQQSSTSRSPVASPAVTPPPSAGLPSGRRTPCRPTTSPPAAPLLPSMTIASSSTLEQADVAPSVASTASPRAQFVPTIPPATPPPSTPPPSPTLPPTPPSTSPPHSLPRTPPPTPPPPSSPSRRTSNSALPPITPPSPPPLPSSVHAPDGSQPTAHS